MKNSINGVQGWLTDLITYITKVANGDLATSVAKASGQDQIHERLVLLKTNIEALVTDSRAITPGCGRRQARNPLRRRQAPGSLSQNYRGFQPDAGHDH